MRYLTIEEVAIKLGLLIKGREPNVRQVYRLIAMGMPFTKLGKLTRVPEKDLEDWLSERTLNKRKKQRA
jgi:excisionase family DNA binding protein